jgi:gliding motility-associated protein GldM
MAHEKLSPRQKMIGMMYLVLTAMLALNVSKDAVEAFKKVDNSLQLTVKNYELKNNVIYADFDRAAAENPTKAGKYRDQAYQVKQRADELFDYLHGIKVAIIKEAEGEDTLLSLIRSERLMRTIFHPRYLSVLMKTDWLSVSRAL